ncbi:MAG: nitroreductase [Pseudomonadota bacterium]|nr:nitroreductase [Pseudomonadota bacterium]MEE3071994.1 nitroreductase [Pseudomonadota bacterium]
MTEANQAALDFLLSRRSTPIPALKAPAPDRDQLTTILTAAARSPDHGKLEPWRFVVLEKAALERVAQAIAKRGPELGIEQAKIDKPVGVYGNSPLAVVVVESPKDSDKVPAIEQTYSAGAVCLSLVNAAMAMGFGANWVSNWFSHDKQFREEVFGLADHETVAGVIHIGTPSAETPDRPRPDLDQITTWISE